MTSGKVIEAGHSPEDQDDPAPRALVAQARDLRAGLAEIAAAPPARRRAARAAYEAARDDVVYRQLAELPLTRLKETTQGRLRLGAIEAAGYRTVGQAGAARRSRAPADTRGRSPDGNPGHSCGPPAQ